MPFGIDDPVIGYATFAVIKLGGYNLAAFYLKYRYPKSTIHPVFSGLTRTVLGMVFGALLLLVINSINLAALSIFYLLLVPVRFIEWGLLIWLFYDRKFENKNKAIVNILLGTVWSFLLDIPVIIGVILTARLWIC